MRWTANRGSSDYVRRRGAHNSGRKPGKTDGVLQTNKKAGDILAAPQGFEPRYAESESAVLPLNEGATLRRQFFTGSTDFMMGFESGQIFCGNLHFYRNIRSLPFWFHRSSLMASTRGNTAIRFCTGEVSRNNIYVRTLQTNGS
jgi:hypothetical protein